MSAPDVLDHELQYEFITSAENIDGGPPFPKERFLIVIVDERPGMDIDPTLNIYRDDEEEPVLTVHLDPDSVCVEAGHVIVREREDPCEYAGHDPHSTDEADGVRDGGAAHVWITTCRRCGIELRESEPDEDGNVVWEAV